MSWQRFIAGFDVHGDEQDPSANTVFFDFCDTWKPKIRVMGGDLWDMRPLRRGASQDERGESMRSDFEAGMRWIKRFRPHYFLRGNHDERLYVLRDEGTGVEADYAAHGCNQIEALMADMKCQMLPYDKRLGVLKLGHLKILHGFHCGVYAARQTALVYGSCIFGHIHAIDEHAIPGLERRAARACGCLCNLSMNYASRKPNTLRQAHGFSYGVLNDKTGDYWCWTAESINGKWVIPTDTIQYG